MMSTRHPKKASQIWAQFSNNYTDKVFSVTQFPSKLHTILNELVWGDILDLGCGPTTFLLKELIARNSGFVMASDFCEEMLQKASTSLKASKLVYLLADNKSLPLKGGSVDTVISINSILPETRPEVDEMFAEVARVVRRGGRLLAVLPSFEMSFIARDKWDMVLELDIENHREYDTTGWQCFYTKEDIIDLMHRYGFRRFTIKPLIFNAPEEIEHIRTVYPSTQNLPTKRLFNYPLFEHFLVAER